MRQNIDEKWKEDPRKKALAKRIGERAANGMRVEVNWLLLDYRGKPIPLKVFQFVDDWQAWVDCGLAEIKGEHVHVAGADAYGDFFDKQKENASKGGKAKAAKRKPKLPIAAQKRPDCPSFSSSSSSSFSPSSSASENPTDSKPQAFVAKYCELFKARWGVNPQIQGKDAGILKRLAESMGHARFEFLLKAYLAMPDAWLVKQKHPVNLFESKLNEVVVYADSGQFTTNTQVRQADNMATNVMLLKKIQDGEL